MMLQIDSHTDSATATPSVFLTQNLDSLRRKMHAENLDALLFTHLPHIRWLTNFSGSNAALILTPEACWLITDGRYAEQVKTEVKHAEPVISADGFLEELKQGKFLPKHGSIRFGFQADKLSYSVTESLRTALPHLTLVPLASFCDEFVAVKAVEELEAMQAAVAISDKVFHKILTLLSPDMTEREVGAEISYWNKRYGADKDAFDPIVASGERGALPHARPTDAKLRTNTFTVIDMGCSVRGYNSDQTRTVALGKVSGKAQEIYSLVLEAHLLGIASAKPGLSGKELDSIARTFFEARGVADYFGHSLGHGIGIEVHQAPIIGRKTEMKIPSGAVITIEPGLYLPNEFGVRIEDMVLVTDSGVTPFQTAPKHLIEL